MAGVTDSEIRLTGLKTQIGDQDREQGSAESVGRLTTQSVVEAIFLVIIVDAVFSILFSYLGI